MQIESLRVFCDLVDTASFSIAAERNGITQSAVSQQIRNLEKRYSVVFFERGKKSFSVTPEGQAFNTVAREILELYEGIDEQLKEIRDVVAGRLRIASIYSIGLHELPPVLSQFRDRFPEVEVEVEYLRSNQVYLEVLDGRADVGLVAYPKTRKGILIEEYATDKLVLICAPNHRLASRKRVRLEGLEDEKFISFATDLPTRRALDRMFREAGVYVQQIREFDNIETLKRAVEVEGGVSIVPESTIRRETANGVLVAVDIMSERMWRPLGMVRKRTKATTAAMRELLTFLNQPPLVAKRGA